MSERMYVRVPIGALLRRVRSLQATAKDENANENELIGKWTKECAIWLAAGILDEGIDDFIDDVRNFTDNPRFNGRPPVARIGRRRKDKTQKQETDE